MAKEIKAYECEKCGKAYIYESAAENCCKEIVKEPKRCSVCGCEIPDYRTICDQCGQQRNYEKGTKIKLSEYELGWLYDENTERFFTDYDDMAEYYEQEELEMPKWCYGCDEVSFGVDIDSALESAGEEMYEDFDYESESVDLKELCEFIDKWNKKQTAKAYESDYKQIILLNE